MDIVEFLQEVWCVNEIGDVKGVNTIFNIEKSCLDYRALLTHPRTQCVILTVHLFRDVFGFFPSYAFVCEMLSDIPEWDQSVVMSRFQNRTFLKYVRAETSLGKGYEKARIVMGSHLHALHNNARITKDLLWKWLARDCGECVDELAEDVTLYTGYLAHLKSRRCTERIWNVNQMPEVTGDRLAWNDIHVRCPYVCDRVAHHVTLNMNYWRKHFGKMGVYVDNHPSITQDVALRLVRAIGEFFEKDYVIVWAPEQLAEGLKAQLPRRYHIETSKLVPRNVLAGCFWVRHGSAIKSDGDDEIARLGFGTTTVRRLVIAHNVSIVNATMDAILVIEQPDARLIAAILPFPVVPLFGPHEFSSLFFRLRMEVNGKDVSEYQHGRAAIYGSLLCTPPFHSRVELPLRGVYKLHSSSENALLVLDTRPNIMSVLSLMVSAANLDRNKYGWDIVIGTSAKARPFFAAHISDAHYFEHPLLDQEFFDIESLNILMKKPDMWQFLANKGYKTVLLVQDDGMIVRKGLEQTRFFTEYTYSGAPWITAPGNEELLVLTQGKMVGNGGLSLRNVKEMIDITTQHSSEADTLFNNTLQPIQEDVYFAKFASKTAASVEEASAFSVEQIMNINALGFHKVWQYHSLQKTLDFALGICRTAPGEK